MGFSYFSSFAYGMQSGLVMTSMDARLFVVYELHLLHVMRPQMNLEWFWYMDVFSWMCMMVLQQRFAVLQRFAVFQQQTNVF